MSSATHQLREPVRATDGVRGQVEGVSYQFLWVWAEVQPGGLGGCLGASRVAQQAQLRQVCGHYPVPEPSGLWALLVPASVHTVPGSCRQGRQWHQDWPGHSLPPTCGPGEGPLLCATCPRPCPVQSGGSPPRMFLSRTTEAGGIQRVLCLSPAWCSHR